MATLEEIAHKKISCKKITEFKILCKFLYKLKYSWENEVRKACKVHRRSNKQKYFIIIRNLDDMLIEDIPLCFNSRSIRKCFKITLKTQEFINISILV
jgi:hypothetical protein